MISSVLTAFGIVDGSLMGSLFSCADCVLTNFVLELSSLLCADARFSYSGLTAQGENLTTKLVRTCPLIVVLGKNLMSD